jgi:hypothetical protein
MAKSTWESSSRSGTIEGDGYVDSGRVLLSVRAGDAPRARLGADSMDGECGARLQVMSRRMQMRRGQSVLRGCNRSRVGAIV